MGKIVFSFEKIWAYGKAKFPDSFPYLGIFLVFLLGSGLLPIAAATLWFQVTRYGIIAAVLGIGVWTWARARKSGHPPVAYLQLALFVPFTIDFHLHYAFILLTVVLFNRKLLLPWNSPLKPIVVLFIWGFISYLVNQFVEFNPFSFPLHAITFFLPFVFFALFYSQTTEAARQPLLDFFYRVLLLMILVIVLRVAFSWSGNPDVITGGTQGTHHAAICLSIAFLSLVFPGGRRCGARRNHDGQKKALLLLTLPVIFLIDAKYVMVFLVVAIGIAALFSRSLKPTAKALAAFVMLAFLVLWIHVADGALPLSKSALSDKGFKVRNIASEFSTSPKAKLLKHALALPVNDPLIFIIGSGPGTFLSRAANSRAPVKDGKRAVSYGRQVIRVASKLPGFLPPFESQVKKKYGRDFQHLKSHLGSIYYWGSSILNVYFETGIVGLLVFIGFFIQFLLQPITARKNKAAPDHGTRLIALSLFLFLLAFNQLWYEQPAFQIVAYSMLGLFVRENRPESDPQPSGVKAC